jgi:opacity protein-like surface antigen
MRLKLYVGLAFALLLISATYSAHAQTIPAARGQMEYSPFAIGVGFSGYNPDYGHGHLLGGTLWIDYFPNRVPRILRGLGIEAEARDLSFGRSTSEPVNMRIDYAGGGLIYSWPRFRKFRPYAKSFMGFGNADDGYYPPLKHYNHDSRTVTSFGGGLDYKAFKRVWVRGDYEYQTWPTFFKHVNPSIPSGRLNPQGFTLGAMYHF